MKYRCLVAYTTHVIQPDEEQVAWPIPVSNYRSSVAVTRNTANNRITQHARQTIKLTIGMCRLASNGLQNIIDIKIQIEI